MHVAIDMWRIVIAVVAFSSLACHHERSRPSLPSAPVAVAPTPPPEVRESQLARGEYVAAISGCTTCHGKNLAGGDKMPNITPDPETGVGTWSDSQIVAAIRQGVRPDGARLAPLMPYPFYNRMTDADANALVVYMRARPALHHRVVRERLPMKPIDVAAPVASVDRVEDPRAHGEYIASLMHCGACHTPQQGPFMNQGFAGGTKFGATIASNITPDRDTGIGAFDETDIIRAVREMKGPSGQDIHDPMASYKDGWSQLTDDDGHALAVFLKSLPPVHHDITQEVAPTVSRRP